MQVKKYEASTVIEALKEVKKDLGPDAIILSTQEAKKSIAGGKKFIVVAAVSDYQLKKKELTEKQLGPIFEQKISQRSATQQKAFIENVYKGAEKKYQDKNRKITQTPYIDIDDAGVNEDMIDSQIVQAATSKVTANPAQSSMARVKQAAQEAFKSSLSSEFFGGDKKAKATPSPVNNPSPTSHAEVLSEPMARMLKRLYNCGVLPEICDGLKKQALRELGRQSDRQALVDSWFAKWILHHTDVTDGSSEPVEIFVGPQGVGKTTSLVKAAAHHVVNENKKVALITTDLNRVGAVEQLRVYSRILNAPVYVAKDINQLEVLISQLKSYDKVLVDTPGSSLSNIADLDFMRGVSRIAEQQSGRVHLVISALTKEKDLGGILKAFRVADFQDIVVNNIDQTSQHGILINIQSKADKPFHSFGIGSDVVDGFELASRERVLDLVFRLTKKIGDRGHDSRI